jgi:hypothetical protein
MTATKQEMVLSQIFFAPKVSPFIHSAGEDRWLPTEALTESVSHGSADKVTRLVIDESRDTSTKSSSC